MLNFGYNRNPPTKSRLYCLKILYFRVPNDMPINPELLEKLAYPNCGNDLVYKEASNTLICSVYDCTFPLAKDVPIMIGKKEGKEIKDESESHPHGFDYLEHCKTDAEQFDYFEERIAATEHSERRMRNIFFRKFRRRQHPSSM